MKNVVTTISFLLVMILSTSAFARSNRVAQLPNGGDFGCDICHTAANGLNDFGFDSFDYTANGNVQWGPELAALDSDRDGYPNGVELGDPTGSWRPGNGNPNGQVSDPGDPMSTLCGNGSLEGNEECEGGNLQGESCDSLGQGVGTLRCSPTTCTFDTSSCGSCGDNIAQTSEDCDGTELNGASCEMLGFSGGTLACSSSCQFNTGACEGGSGNGGYSLCGDGLATGAEPCDSFDLRAQTCQTLGFDGGALDCTATCEYNTNGCTGAGPVDPPNDQPANSGNPSTPTTGGALGDPGAQSSDPSNRIEMSGHVCTVTNVDGRSPWAPVAIFFGLFVLGVRSRSRNS